MLVGAGEGSRNWNPPDEMVVSIFQSLSSDFYAGSPLKSKILTLTFAANPPSPRQEDMSSMRQLQNCKYVFWWFGASMTPSEMSSSWFSIDIFICPSLFRSWPLSLWPKLFYVESKTLPPPGTFPAWEDPPQSVLLLGLRELENTVGGLVFPFPSTPC